MKPRIQLIPSHQIDKEKWDQCVDQYGLIYSGYTYLNTMCDYWHGLVINDYEAVMPLPWRKKWGIRYACMPAFTQQLGVTGNGININWDELIHCIQKFVSLADIHFNFSNTALAETTGITEKTNFIIHLQNGYENITSNYRTDLKENIKKASSHQLSYADADINEALFCFQNQYAGRLKNVREYDYQRFSQLCLLLQAEEKCFARAVKDKNGQLTAIALFLKDSRRIYNLMNTTLPAGRKLEANHFLLDSLIAEFAGSPLIFDMEGSDLPGVQQFYASFGPENQPYFHYHFNGLSWPLRLVKR